MPTLWFILVAFMLTMYVLLDGFDLGAGIIHLLVARTDTERRLNLRAIGPVWDGNEVWLIAAGGTLFFAFPLLYASSFSGFYLPLIIVLWLLIGRGVAIELRSRLPNTVWASFWDGVFFFSSALLASSSARLWATSFEGCRSMRKATSSRPCGQTSTLLAPIQASWTGIPS